MKTTITLLMTLASLSTFANTMDATVVQENGTTFLKTKKAEAYLVNNNARFDLVNEDDTLSVKIANKLYPIAKFEEGTENDTSNKRVSTNKIQVNMIVNKEEKKFKATLCSHMGCLPYPHFESTLRQLIEIKTLDGETLCYNNNVTDTQSVWKVGTCNK